jgi:hypothetical protein
MMTRRALATITIMTLAGLASVPAVAQQDVRKVKLTPPQQKVIEEKCLVCHNRKRIEAAIEERKDMEKILKRMEVKGAVLTENERRVMGHFWPRQPFKEKKGEAPK